MTLIQLSNLFCYIMTFHDNFFSCSVDDWESKQAGWTQTAKVLKHFAEDVVTKFPGNLQCAVM